MLFSQNFIRRHMSVVDLTEETFEPSHYFYRLFRILLVKCIVPVLVRILWRGGYSRGRSRNSRQVCDIRSKSWVPSIVNIRSLSSVGNPHRLAFVIPAFVKISPFIGVTRESLNLCDNSLRFMNLPGRSLECGLTYFNV